MNADGLQGDNDVFNLHRNVNHDDRLVGVGGAEAMMPNGASSWAGGGGVRVGEAVMGRVQGEAAIEATAGK